MIEIQQIGKRHAVYELEAKIMPERFLIKDLIDCAHEAILEISEEEYKYLKSEILKDHEIY